MKTAVKVICVLGSGLALCLWTGYACMIGYRIGEQDTKSITLNSTNNSKSLDDLTLRKGSQIVGSFFYILGGIIMNMYQWAKNELKLARENEIAQCKKNSNYHE